ncbi:hypothetical protein MLD38_017942 [Melastoma candidum]|uniref:Uncharacterized protein n=1 Tax=Melastoma candidum TaxID=119954 RepID=A0ACB9QRP9_9MYRT|nr:hypothetical protein MLD38_017942 [Melastoma candidum]
MESSISSAACFSHNCIAKPSNSDGFSLKPRVGCLRLSCSRNHGSGMRKSVILNAKKVQKKYDFGDSGTDDSIGFFPEAVLLKERKVQEDGKRMPEFADADEKELFEFLSLQLESDLNVELRRHYEVVYLIHEKNAEEVSNVNQKIEDFLREKKGTVWRFEDWGLRTLAYKIKKAKKAHYILMNFEIEAQWINEFKHMLDTDERIIRHLVMKRKEAITKVQPPPPEFHTFCANTDDLDEEDDEFLDDVGEDLGDDEVDAEGETWEEEGDVDIVMVDDDEEEDEEHKGRAKRSSRSKVVVG